MKRSKKISLQDYGSPLHLSNRQEEIQELVNKESYITEVLPEPAPPKPLQVKKQELSLVSAYVFVKHMTYHSMRQFKP